jgi:hypothetical protein
MRKFVLYVLLFCLIFAAGSSVAIFIGRRQLPPEWLAALHLTDCAPPCWIGIIPGKTTLDEAKKAVKLVLNRSPVSEINQGQYLRLAYTLPVQSQSQHFVVELTAKADRLVRTISFGHRENSALVTKGGPTLAELQGIFGSPKRILVQDIVYGGAAFDYGEDNRGALVFIFPMPFSGRQRLTWATSSQQIIFYGIDGIEWDPNRSPPEIYQWRGFYRYFIPRRP